MKSERALVIYSVVLVCVIMQMNYASPQKECLEDQRQSLLKLKDNLRYNSSNSTKLSTWNQTTHCCQWSGVSCNEDGAVAALDLSNESISDGLDDSTSLIALTSLQSLNLSYNPLLTQKIPSSIYSLTRLSYLNLASANLSGPINESLSKLIFLEELHLGFNAFLSPVPAFFANFTRLKSLYLTNSFFIGEFPEAIFHLPSIEVIGLAKNNELSGWLPDFHPNSSIKQIGVQETRFGGIIPKSIGNLNLVYLMLGGCEFSGEIPLSVFNMSGLIGLGLSDNKFRGVIELHWIRNLPSLILLSLSDNLFTVNANRDPLDQLQDLELDNCSMVEFPVFSNQSVLRILSIDGNHLQGSIPFLPQTLTILNLSNNNLSSSTLGDVIAKLASLNVLIIANSGLHGEIPSSICNATRLVIIQLQSNELRGSIPECLFRNLSDLETFDVTVNNLDGAIPDAFQEGCNIESFNAVGNMLGGPFPKSIVNCKGMQEITLGSNEIFGPFPCELTHFSQLADVDLFRNYFHGDISCVGDWPKLQVLQLSFNNFTGFSAFHNSTSMARLSSLWYLSLDKNRMADKIPSALCNVSAMQHLSLTMNYFNGAIPECLFRDLTSLNSLHLLYNSIGGSIPDSFQANCAVQFLSVAFNILQGPVPQSLENCAQLQVLDLGNNRIKDSFPCQLKSLQNLTVLSLRGNLFEGDVDCIGSDDNDWRSLRIIDISRNQFGGVLPRNAFASCVALITDNRNYSKIHYGSTLNITWNWRIGGKNYTAVGSDEMSFIESMTANWKGSDELLIQTLGLASAIDFSQNRFRGPIPESIGLLSTLQSINLSHNDFSGEIPKSLGNLTNLESLDLSNNQLSGIVPPQLAGLAFLQRFNVSMNRLSGRIPTGTQMQSFPASSYQGNDGLYGPPLPDLCNRKKTMNDESCDSSQSTSNQSQASEDILRWFLESAALGFVVGMVLHMGSLGFLRNWRRRYSLIVDSIVSKFVN